MVKDQLAHSHPLLTAWHQLQPPLPLTSYAGKLRVIGVAIITKIVSVPLGIPGPTTAIPTH